MQGQKRVPVYRRKVVDGRWWFVHYKDFADEEIATEIASLRNSVEPTVLMALCTKQHPTDWARVVTTDDKHMDLRVYFVGACPSPQIQAHCRAKGINVM